MSSNSEFPFPNYDLNLRNGAPTRYKRPSSNMKTCTSRHKSPLFTEIH